MKQPTIETVVSRHTNESRMPPVTDADTEVELTDEEKAAQDAAAEGDVEEVEEEVEVAAATPAFDWSKIEEQIGELPAEADANLLELVGKGSLGELPEEARTVIKHVIARQKAAEQALAAEKATGKAALDKREADLDEDARKLNEQMAQFATLFKTDAAKAMLAKASDTSPLDLLTAEGQAAKIEREIAKAWKTTADPLLASAEKAEKVAKYHALVAKTPEMQNEAFKGEVRDLVVARKATTSPLSTEDAIEIVKGRRLAADRAARTDADRRARADAMRRVSPPGPGGTATTRESPEQTAARILKTGGVQALTQHYENNKKALKEASRAFGVTG